MKDQQSQPCDLDGNPVTPGLPMAMLAEVTHRCPLACPYCSNPVELTRAAQELSADDWGRVFRQAADLGVDFGATLTEAEVVWLMDHEYARRATDVVWRRTKLGLRLDADQVQVLDQWIQARWAQGAAAE